jgi:hypothetical protein
MHPCPGAHAASWSFAHLPRCVPRARIGTQLLIDAAAAASVRAAARTRTKNGAMASVHVRGQYAVHFGDMRFALYLGS